MKRSNKRSRSRRAIGAAVAGILAGASLAVGCGQTSEAKSATVAEASDDANGCNGPNGCGSESESEKGDTAKHAEATADAK